MLLGSLQRESKANHGQLGVYDDQLIAGLGDLAEAIQEWGTKAILQICHAGRFQRRVDKRRGFLVCSY